MIAAAAAAAALAEDDVVFKVVVAVEEAQELETGARIALEDETAAGAGGLAFELLLLGDTKEEPLTTGFRATMGKFCAAAKRVVVAEPGLDDKNPKPEGTERGFVAVTDAGIREFEAEDAAAAFAFAAAAAAAAAFDFREPLLARGRGPYRCVFS